MPEDSGTTISQGIQQSDKEWKREKEKKILFLSLLRWISVPTKTSYITKKIIFVGLYILL